MRSKIKDQNLQTIRPSPRAVTPRTTTTTERATEAPEEEQERATVGFSY